MNFQSIVFVIFDSFIYIAYIDFVIKLQIMFFLCATLNFGRKSQYVQNLSAYLFINQSYLDSSPGFEKKNIEEKLSAVIIVSLPVRTPISFKAVCIVQGCKLPLAHSPMRPNVVCGLPEIKNWSPTWRQESRCE